MTTAPPPEAPTTEETRRRVRGALLRYRVLAWVTGIWLLLLVAEMVAKYILKLEMPSWTMAIPPAHGFVYLVYLLLTLDLAIKARWRVPVTLVTLIAGTIPFLSFYVEHLRTREVREAYSL